MVYGYARCSTNEDKQDINRQILELQNYGIAKEHIYWDYISGKSDKKVNWDRLLSVVEQGDTIAATEVSRVTRSTKQLCSIIEVAKDKKLKLVFGGFVVDFTGVRLDPMVEGMLKLLGVFAEMERDMTSYRIKSGLDNARAKGVKIGRPGVGVEDIPKSFLKHYASYVAGNIKVAELSRLCEISRPTCYKYIKMLQEGKK